MSVGVTDKAKEEMQEDGYVCEQSELGNVFYPEEGIIVSDKIVVKRMEYPWLTCFEVEGIDIIKPERRVGI